MSVRLHCDVAEFGTAGARVRPVIRKSMHRHNEIELNFLESGKFDLLFGNARYTLTEGRLYVFWAAIPHKIVHLRQSSTFYWLTVPFKHFLSWHLPGRLIESLLSGKFVSDLSLGMPRRDSVQFATWMHDIRSRSKSRHEAMLLEVEARMIRLAGRLSQNSYAADADDGEGPPSPAILKAHQMARYICRHYVGPLSSNDVAEHIGLHPNYAMSLFKNVYGISIGGFVTRYRVVQAQKMLVMTNMKIEEIIGACGFKSTSQFYAAFKAHALQTPHQFRKRY
ncbi:MAG: helix-turn-helix domain-containing protein [Alphaproteobacteria bacterium]|nr:MAG: helix-turn-helix domain-containing protein [Alphaproteobacteria bacterium]